jgi:hypothetical protein
VADTTSRPPSGQNDGWSQRVPPPGTSTSSAARSSSDSFFRLTWFRNETTRTVSEP